MDDEPKLETVIVGDTVHLRDVLQDVTLATIPMVQGPPGPAGTLDLTDSSGFVDGIIDSIRAAHYGSREVPAVRFEVDGWEYAFPTDEHARKVRDKLIRMTLEGEL